MLLTHALAPAWRLLCGRPFLFPEIWALTASSRFRAPLAARILAWWRGFVAKRGYFFFYLTPAFLLAGIPGHDPPGIPFYLVLHVLSL